MISFRKTFSKQKSCVWQILLFSFLKSFLKNLTFSVKPLRPTIYLFHYTAFSNTYYVVDASKMYEPFRIMDKLNLPHCIFAFPLHIEQVCYPLHEDSFILHLEWSKISSVLDLCSNINKPAFHEIFCFYKLVRRSAQP